MKKYLSFILILVFLLALSPFCFADKSEDAIGTIVDNNNLINAEDRAVIESCIEYAYWQHGYSIVVVFEEYLPEYDSDRAEYTELYYFGGNFSSEGIMLFVGVNSRTYDIYSSHQSGYSKISEDELDNIDDRVYPYLASNDFSGAARVFAEQALSAIESGDNERYYIGGKTRDELLRGVGISFFLGAIVSIIVLLVMSSNMKGIRKQSSAGNYIDRGSVKVTRRRDSFLYSTVTKVRRDTESSSGGRSSSRSSGGSHRGGRF